MSTFRKEIAEILGHKFGEDTKRMIMEQYSDDNPQEIYEVAEHMLTAFMGKKNSQVVLSGLAMKYGLKKADTLEGKRIRARKGK